VRVAGRWPPWAAATTAHLRVNARGDCGAQSGDGSLQLQRESPFVSSATEGCPRAALNRPATRPCPKCSITGARYRLPYRTLHQDPIDTMTQCVNINWQHRSAYTQAHGELAVLIGYARTSTVEQDTGFDAQLRDLKAQGVDKVFSEQVSSVAEREELERALDYCREGDTLIVTKLDRLARSVHHLCKIVERLQSKGVSLRIMGMGLDTATANGRLMLNVFGAVAQFEREVMLERQREGIAKAKSEGKYKGREPTALQQADHIKALVAQGWTRAKIADELEISLRSVYRALHVGVASSRAGALNA
jgi:DNA invertase Pin-like site-specific DNA recombinase